MVRTVTLCLSLLLSTITSAVSVVVSVTNATCGQCNGSATAFADGGLPPYSFSWSPVPASGQGTQTIQGLCEGTWTVEVTDGLGNTAQADAIILTGTTLNTQGMTELRPACDGGCFGWGYIMEASLGGTAPYTYDFPSPQVVHNVVGNGSVAFAGVCPGLNTIAVTDANGCTGTVEGWIMDAQSGPPQVLSTTPACGSGANGAIIMSGAGAFGYAAYMVDVNGSQVVYSFNSDGPYTLDGLAPGTYDVYTWNEFGSGLPGLEQPGVMYCTSGAQATVGSINEPCGSVSGQVYHDANEDCVFNNFDTPQPYRVLSIEPIGSYAISDGLGRYQQQLWLGNYFIDLNVTPQETTVCPATTPVAFEISGTTPEAVVDFAKLSTMPLDLSVSVNSSNARPGFATQVWVTVSNLSAFPSDEVSLSLSFNGLLLNAVPANGTWDLGVIPPYGFATRTFHALVPADINLLGIDLDYVATVTNAGAETNTANNTATTTVTITGSYDPNDKTGRTSTGFDNNLYFADLDEWIDYTVRFQNTGTAAAETVVIRDTIDGDFDITSLQILGATHDFTPSFDAGRTLIFTFNNINLPDSTSDLAGSQGSISFRLKPRAGITFGDVLENSAGIYFDFNPPIITNTVEHVVEFSTLVNGDVEEARPIVLSPNPATDRIIITGITSSIALIEVLAADGRAMRSISPMNNAFDVTNLEPGYYLARIHTKDGRSYLVRFTRA
jgi:uncharacterized repeat protein (TIGR01451 family)